MTDRQDKAREADLNFRRRQREAADQAKKQAQAARDKKSQDAVRRLGKARRS